jgi:filamentous hemagglutinin
MSGYGVLIVGGTGGGSGAKGVGVGAKFADQASADDHFARHGGDFGEKNTLEYQAQTNNS